MMYFFIFSVVVALILVLAFFIRDWRETINTCTSTNKKKKKNVAGELREEIIYYIKINVYNKKNGKQFSNPLSFPFLCFDGMKKVFVNDSLRRFYAFVLSLRSFLGFFSSFCFV